MLCLSNLRDRVLEQDHIASHCIFRRHGLSEGLENLVGDAGIEPATSSV